MNPYTKLGTFTEPGDETVYLDPAEIESVEAGEWLLTGSGKRERGCRVLMASMAQHYLAADPTELAEEVRQAKEARFGGKLELALAVAALAKSLREDTGS